MRKHSGSIFSFIIIGLVLVVATGLVVFAVNSRTSEDSVVDDVISQVDEDSDRSDREGDSQGSDEGGSESSSEERGPQSTDESSGVDESTEESSVDGSDGEVNIPSEIERESQSEDESNGEGVSGESSTPSDSTGGPVRDVNTGTLPETGPAQDLLSSAIGILAIVGSGYIYYHFGRNQQ